MTQDVKTQRTAITLYFQSLISKSPLFIKWASNKDLSFIIIFVVNLFYSSFWTDENTIKKIQKFDGQDILIFVVQCLKEAFYSANEIQSSEQGGRILRPIDLRQKSVTDFFYLLFPNLENTSIIEQRERDLMLGFFQDLLLYDASALDQVIRKTRAARTR